jgi:uncharacterized protein YggE
MHTRRIFTFVAALLLVAALAAGMAFQRGSAQAANLAQATQTGLATGSPTAATPVTTATAIITAAPTTTRLTPTPAGTQVPLPTNMPARTVTVSGLGETSAQPDEAFLSVGVQTDADTASEALEQNNQQMEALMEALVDAGVAAGDVQTQFVTLYPRYADGSNGGTTGIVGYTAVNSVEVHVRDLDTLGDLLDAAVAAGGNTISGIRFSVSDADELTNQARADAMDDARDRAQQLATLAGATLGPVLSITEGGSQRGPIFETGADVGGATVPIVPGSQTLQVNLEVTWLLQ